MHPVLSNATRLILAGDIAGAERALVKIAEEEGDHALVAVMDDLPAKDLVAILREYDTSRESVINLLVTPEQFARSVVLERQYAEPNFSRLHGMINSVVHKDHDEASAYLAKLVETHQGCETLADYFTDYLEGFLCFTLEGVFVPEKYPDLPDESHYIPWLVNEIGLKEHLIFQTGQEAGPVMKRADAADGDWMETAWILRYEMQEGFEHVYFVIRDRILKITTLADVPASKPSPAVPAKEVEGDQDDEELAI